MFVIWWGLTIDHAAQPLTCLPAFFSDRLIGSHRVGERGHPSPAGCALVCALCTVCTRSCAAPPRRRRAFRTGQLKKCTFIS